MERERDAYQRIMQLLRSYREAQLLIAFAELGLGDALVRGPRTSPEIAAAVGADPVATERFLRAAVAVGLLEQQGDRYANAELASTALTSTGASSLVNLVRREAAFYRRWSHLAEAVRTGGRPEANRRDEEDPSWVRDFTLALRDSARLSAPVVAEALAPLIERLDHPARVIDVGGGSGEYSVALARRYPGLEAVVFDLPPVLAVTHDLLAATEVSGRVTARAGDFHLDPLGEHYDLALLFGVLVGESEERSLQLLRTVRRALRPGGFVVVRTPTLGAGSSPLDEALVDLHMLLSTDGGGSRGAPNVEHWLNEADFVVQPPIALPAPASGQLLIGLVALTAP